MLTKILKKVISLVLVFVFTITSFPQTFLTVNAEMTEFAGGSGTEDDPYLISTKQHLNHVRNALNAHYRLISDIEFTEADFADGGEFYNDGEGWLPIGTVSSSAFTGVFDGDNHTISGITIRTVKAQEDAVYIGLFGALSAGEIRNLKLTDSSLYAENTLGSVSAGGIVGYANNDSTIVGCAFNGAISISALEDANAGGIVGRSYNMGIILNCVNYADVHVTSTSRFVYAGGIIGEYYHSKSGEISYSHNEGNITATGKSDMYVGGIAGDLSGNVSKCYNQGNVSSISLGSIPFTGGIAGYSSQTITDSYNLGEVSVDTSQCFWAGIAGGIVGKAESDAQIRFCYNAGKLISVAGKANETLGGIIGSCSSSTTLEGCYYHNRTAKAGIGKSGALTTNIDGSTISCSDTEMTIKTTFVGFDYDLVWLPGSADGTRLPTLRAYEEEAENETRLLVYSDYPNLSVPKGDTITLYVRALVDGEISPDTDGIAFSVENAENLHLTDSGIEDGIRYARFEAVNTGTAMVTFSDSNTGKTLTAPITVYDRTVMAYTIESLPTIFNFNGMYVDAYQYNTNTPTGDATVSFNVYNRNRMYGTVESYYANGELCDVVLIEKNEELKSSIYETLGEGAATLVKDIFFTGDLFSYRQTSLGYSTLTTVTINVPKNGYFRICIDPLDSDYVNLVNSVDIILAAANIVGSCAGYSEKSVDFSKKLIEQIKSVGNDALLDAIDIAELTNIYDVYLDSKVATVDAATLWEFAVNLSERFAESDLLKEIVDNVLLGLNIDFAENVFVQLSGPAAVGFNAVFLIADISNWTKQVTDFSDNTGVGSPSVQYNTGNFVSCNRVQVKSESGFESGTALSVFTLSLEEELIEKLKTSAPEVYKAIEAGKSYTYNISLVHSENQIQPESPVSVFIPVPAALTEYVQGDNVKVYRVEEDGSLTDMDAWAEDNMLTFLTDHFSLYIIAGIEAQHDNVHEPEDNQPSQDNENKDDNSMLWIAIAVIAVAVAGIGVFIVCKKKKHPKQTS